MRQNSLHLRQVCGYGWHQTPSNNCSQRASYQTAYRWHLTECSIAYMPKKTSNVVWLSKALSSYKYRWYRLASEQNHRNETQLKSQPLPAYANNYIWRIFLYRFAVQRLSYAINLWMNPNYRYLGLTTGLIVHLTTKGKRHTKIRYKLTGEVWHGCLQGRNTAWPHTQLSTNWLQSLLIISSGRNKESTFVCKGR